MSKPKTRVTDGMDEAELSRLRDRFSNNTVHEPISGCLLWVGHTNTNGYGVLRINGRRVYAHRLAYALEHGRIPDGELVLHHCDNPACVNAAMGHLFAGSHADNTHDMVAKGRHKSQKRTHCVRGHAFDAANTVLDKRGNRRCSACWADRDARRYREHRERELARHARNKDKRSVWQREYYVRNRDSILARQREYVELNHDAILSRRRALYAARKGAVLRVGVGEAVALG
jgi:hypothetical protein